MQRSISNHPRRLLWILPVFALVIGAEIFLADFSPDVAQTQTQKALAFSDEFLTGGEKKEKMSFVQTRDIAQRTLNCFFNRAIKAQVEQGVTQYRQKVKEGLPPVNPPSERDTKCDAVTNRPIGSRLLSELDRTLAAIPKNVEKIGEIKKANPLRNDIKPCNFELFDRDATMLIPERNKDYFEERRKETINPTYAAYTIAHCYELFYLQYLNLYFANGDEMAFGIPSDPSDNQNFSELSVDAWIGEKSQRALALEQERRRTQQALRSAVQTLDTFSKTYPLHVQYSAIIEHSKEVRDLIRRIRVAMAQLVYKLRNQTTKNY